MFATRLCLAAVEELALRVDRLVENGSNAFGLVLAESFTSFFRPTALLLVIPKRFIWYASA